MDKKTVWILGDQLVAEHTALKAFTGIASVQVLLIEYEPAGQVRIVETGHVLLVKRGTKGVVIGCLVGEAAASPIDHDRSGPRALRCEQVLVGARWDDNEKGKDAGSAYIFPIGGSH